MTHSQPANRHRLNWRSLASHLVALVAGAALAVALVPSATRSSVASLASSRPAPATEFDRALQAVMLQMDAAMCIAPSGDPDRDFARAMIPHHRGAVEMARLELLYGRDARLRRLAQGIVIEQAQEIALMRRLLAEPSNALTATLAR